MRRMMGRLCRRAGFGKGGPRAVADVGLWGGWWWAGGVYLVGFGVVGVRIVVLMGRVEGIVRRSVALEDAGVRAGRGEATRVRGVERDVSVVVTEEMGSQREALVGGWGPVMVVPRRLIGELSMREWEFVFLHEWCAQFEAE